MIGKRILIVAIFCASIMAAIEGKRVLLRPISAAEVRRILKNAGREDAIPEGRVISQGIAAVKGFALGFKKGVIGLAIADGIAALSLTPSNSNSTAGDGFNKPSVSFNDTSNELCFTSRSATSDIVASGDGRQAPGATTTTATVTTPTTSTTGVISPTTTNTNIGTNTGTGGGSVTNEGSTTTTEQEEPTINCIVIKKKP